METFVREILASFERNVTARSRVGFLLNLMDQVLEEEQETEAEFFNLVTVILKHALQVSKICCSEDEQEISLGTIYIPNSKYSLS